MILSSSATQDNNSNSIQLFSLTLKHPAKKQTTENAPSKEETCCTICKSYLSSLWNCLTCKGTPLLHKATSRENLMSSSTPELTPTTYVAKKNLQTGSPAQKNRMPSPHYVPTFYAHELIFSKLYV